MGRVGIAVKQADREAFRPRAGKEIREFLKCLVSERGDHLDLDVDTFAETETQRPRHQRLRAGNHQIVLLKPVFVTDIDHVGKAGGAHEGGPGAFPLDNRVGGERRAVDDEVNVTGRDAGTCQQIARAF